ncbi:basic proline-rich protein-like [Cervus elaphus]|uniref:basic proline-rich protein-like n=1 Tax=Cervus elaphus TaxID=9860 RepID=UPI001CC29D97|nr:basic proline-rich protein-like [Cervus elaphus]
MGRPGGISVETTALPGAGRHRAAPACLCLAHPKAISLPGDGRLDRRGRQLRLELQDPPCSAGFHTPFLQEWVRAGTVWKSAPGTGTAQAFGEIEVYRAVAAPQCRHHRSLARASTPTHPLGTRSQAPRGPPPFPPVPPRLRAAPAGLQNGPHPGLPRGGPPRPVPATSAHRTRPLSAGAQLRSSPRPRRSDAVRSPSLPGTPGRLGAPPVEVPARGGRPPRSGRPLRPPRARRGPGARAHRAAPAPAAGVARSSPFSSPPALRAFRSSPGTVRRSPRSAPDRAGEPAARPSRPRARRSRRRRGADPSPRTGCRSGGKRHNGRAPEGEGLRRPRSRPDDPGRPPATPDPGPPLTCCSRAGARGLGVAGAPTPPAGAPRRRLPAPRGPRPAPPPARPPRRARSLGCLVRRLVPPARPPRSRLPRPLRPPASSPPTILSARGAGPHSLPSCAKPRGAPAPGHRVANGKCPVPGVLGPFHGARSGRRKLSLKPGSWGWSPALPRFPSLAGSALVQDWPLRSRPHSSDPSEPSPDPGLCDSEWERPTSIRLQLSHSRGPPFHPDSGQTRGHPSSEHSRTSRSEAGVSLPNVRRNPRWPPPRAQEGCWEAGWDPETSRGEARERVPVTPPPAQPPAPPPAPPWSSSAGSLSPAHALTSPAGFGGPLASPVECGPAPASAQGLKPAPWARGPKPSDFTRGAQREALPLRDGGGVPSRPLVGRGIPAQPRASLWKLWAPTLPSVRAQLLRPGGVQLGSPPSPLPQAVSPSRMHLRSLWPPAGPALGPHQERKARHGVKHPKGAVARVPRAARPPRVPAKSSPARGRLWKCGGGGIAGLQLRLPGPEQTREAAAGPGPGPGQAQPRSRGSRPHGGSLLGTPTTLDTDDADAAIRGPQCPGPWAWHSPQAEPPTLPPQPPSSWHFLRTPSGGGLGARKPGAPS